MALKQIMLAKKIEGKEREIENLRNLTKQFEKREKELETAISEAKTEEEQRTIEEEIDKYINQIAFSGVQDFMEKYKDKANEDQIIGTLVLVSTLHLW